MVIQSGLKKLYWFVTGSILMFASMQNAVAVGTDSGIDISNQATVSYEVGGVDQTGIDSNTVVFKVDAVVDLTVTASGSDANGTPGATTVSALEFTVTNDGNEIYDFALSFVEDAGRNFDMSGLAIYVDTNSNGTLDVATEAGISIDNLAADASIKVWLVGTIPATATDNQNATHHLMATALLENGSAIPAEDTDVVTTKQYVYADGAGPHSGDGANDAKHSASLSYVAQTASLTVSKSSAVIWDPVNLGSSPLHIPGAIVEYTIVISNGSGSETASAIVVTDTLGANLAVPTVVVRQYELGSSVQLTAPGGTISNLTDVSDGDQGAVVGGTAVTVTGITLVAGESATVKIRAEIQ